MVGILTCPFAPVDRPDRIISGAGTSTPPLKGAIRAVVPTTTPVVELQQGNQHHNESDGCDDADHQTAWNREVESDE